LDKETRYKVSKILLARRIGAFSVAQSQVDIVIRYIKNQKEHHKTKDFKTEFRGFLNKYEIDYYEKYV